MLCGLEFLFSFIFCWFFFLLFDGKVFVSHPQTLARNSLAPAFELVVFFFYKLYKALTPHRWQTQKRG